MSTRKNKSHAELMKTLKPGERYFLGSGIYARRTSAGVSYGVSYKYNGKVIREIIGTRTDAKQALAKRVTDMSEGTNPRPKKAPTFKEFSKEYEKWARGNKRSWKRDRIIVRHLCAVFDNKRLDQIKTKDVQDYIDGRAKEYTPTGKKVSGRTVNMERSCLRRMFTLALDWERLDRNRHANPVKLTTPRQEAKKPRRILTTDEEAALLAAAAPHLRQIIKVALHTGMRKGQILGLKWSAVDQKETNTITAGPMTDEDLESGFHKNEVSRKIPINAALTRILSELSRDSVFVFTQQGKQIKNINWFWKQAVKASGINDKAVRASGIATFHSLRHTYATRQLIDCGTDLKTVSDVLGHKSLATTERYLHTNEERKREAQRRYDELFG